jgi:hypothetical protein
MTLEDVIKLENFQIYKERIRLIPIVPGKTSGKICPACHQYGGFASERCVKYAINIPPRTKIKTVSDAWDFGARVCLRIAEGIMLFPPTDSRSSSMSHSVYDFWRRFTLHTDEEIALYELTFLNVIPKSIRSRIKYFRSKNKRSQEYYDGTPKRIRDPIHIELPKKSGIATKASVSFVFAACVCLALKDLFEHLSVDNDYRLVRGIYTYFSMYQVGGDFRVFDSWFDYFRIYGNVKDYDFYRASRLAKQVTNICKICKQNKKEIVEMIQEQDTESWKCPECGGQDPVVSHYSVTHLKQKEGAVREKRIDCAESLPIFLDFVERLIYYLKSHPSVSIAFMRLFGEYESKAEGGTLLCKKRHFWKHYDNTKKCKTRWCSLSGDDLRQDTGNHADPPVINL